MIGKRLILIPAFLAALLIPSISVAEEAVESVDAASAQGYTGRPAELKPGSLLGGTIAVMPGVVFHGLGHAYTKDYGSAIGLFCAELAGLGMMLAASYIKSEFGDSYRNSATERLLSHAGFVLFMGSWAADVLGTYKGSAPFGMSRRGATRPHIGLTYRYADNPLHRFRHHMQLKVDMHLGRVQIQPAIDLEAQMERREFSLDVGTRILGDSIVSNHLSLGARFTRLENRIDGWAAQTAMAYMDTRFDLGRFIRSLRRFHIFNRTGYGVAGYQFGERNDNVPALLSETGLTDTWLYLESGGALSVSTGTDLSISLVQDPTGVISPIKISSLLVDASASEVVKFELSHRYEDDAGIEVQFVAGSGFGIWLGLEYAL